MSEAEWQKFRTLARTREYVNRTSTTTYSSLDDCDRSSPLPGSDSDQIRDKRSETDGTSSCESDHLESKKAKDLAIALAQKQKEVAALQAQLQGEATRYKDLEQKHKKHIAKRVDDYVKVTEAYTQFKEMEDQRNELEHRLQALEKKSEAQLCIKNRELAELKAKQDCAISVLESVHQEELAAKNDEVKQVKAIVEEKDAELEAVTQKAAIEQREIESKTNDEKRELLSATKVCREASTKDKEAAEAKLKRVEADAKDALTKNESTIHRVVSKNIRLEKEKAHALRLPKQRLPTQDDLWQVCNAATADQEEAKKLRAELKRTQDMNENLLDKIQQMEGHYTGHQKREQNARIEADDLQRKCYDLEENLDRQKQQTRDVTKQLEQVQAGAVPAGTHCAALDALDLENEQLRALYEAEQVAKSEVQERADQLDNELTSSLIMES